MYTTDTTTFINGWHKLYVPETFPDFWVWIKELFDEGKLLAIRNVREELERHDDGLLKWCKENKIPFVPVSESIEALAADIRKTHPKLLKKARVDTEADPYIIAHAIEGDLIVITEEQPGKVRIPAVCKYYQVECINLREFMLRERVKFFRR
ncbi:MAG: DUF4411 family protein [Chloroflexi bacterium]|nr:DUF4411 family protein [Chloroflexota bacterium]